MWKVRKRRKGTEVQGKGRMKRKGVDVVRYVKGEKQNNGKEGN